jgi:hypothetical protein
MTKAGDQLETTLIFAGKNPRSQATGRSGLHHWQEWFQVFDTWSDACEASNWKGLIFQGKRDSENSALRESPQGDSPDIERGRRTNLVVDRPDVPLGSLMIKWLGRTTPPKGVARSPLGGLCNGN